MISPNENGASDPRRAGKVLNYRTKQAENFECATCGKGDQILAVREKSTGELTTRCDSCLDKRSFDVLPYQRDEAEKLREIIREEKGWA